MFEGAYVRRALCIEGNLRFKFDWAGLQWEGNLPFLLCFTLNSRANSKYNPPGGLYSEGRFNGGFFALRFWGAYIWRGLSMQGLIFGIYGSRFHHVRESKTGFPFRHSGFHAMDSGFQVLYSSLCHWNLDPIFQSLVGFRIP